MLSAATTGRARPPRLAATTTSIDASHAATGIRLRADERANEDSTPRCDGPLAPSGLSVRPPVPAVLDTRVERGGRYTPESGARRGELVLPGPIDMRPTVAVRGCTSRSAVARSSGVAVFCGAVRCGPEESTPTKPAAMLVGPASPPGDLSEPELTISSSGSVVSGSVGESSRPG